MYVLNDILYMIVIVLSCILSVTDNESDYLSKQLLHTGYA